MAWTFDEFFTQDQIEDLLPILTEWWKPDPAMPEGGFVDGAIVIFRFSGNDGEDHYVSKTIGGMRMLSGVGLYECAKLDYIESFRGSEDDE